MKGIILTIITIMIVKIEDKIFFILQSKKEAKKVNYNCKKCKMWPCTHEVEPIPKPLYPCKDYSKYCGKEKK